MLKMKVTRVAQWLQAVCMKRTHVQFSALTIWRLTICPVSGDEVLLASLDTREHVVDVYQVPLGHSYQIVHDTNLF